MEYYSNGKLLITGEYFVLKGALAMAIPLKFGQKTTITPLNTKGNIIWNSFYKKSRWFHAVFDLCNLNVIESTDIHKAAYIETLLREAFKLRPGLQDNTQSLEINNFLDFDPQWGLGSSSTLITNISAWLNINPYILLKNTTGGSGYDLACATSDMPIIYSNKGEPVISKIQLSPVFTQNIQFVYLGNKVSSAESISKHLHKIESNTGLISRINAITMNIANTPSIANFEMLLREHNAILSEVLEIKPFQDKTFSDFQGTIKPLGAWGGDFIMAVSRKKNNYIQEYFNNKGLSVVYSFKDLAK